MDASTLSEPVATDQEALQEFIDILWEYAPTIERDVAHLRNHPTERAVVGNLFRTLHNIKGDAALCKVEVGVAIVHPMESVLVRVRNGELPFTDAIAETILLTVDRLELAVERLSSGQTLDGLHSCNSDRRAGKIGGGEANATRRLCRRVDPGGYRQPLRQPLFHVPPPSAKRNQPDIEGSGSPPADDMLFFLTLANQFEMRSPRFAGRSMRLLRLALETNQAAGDPIDPVQLEAAVYMHDIGMMFLPESTWLKVGHMTPDEIEMMRNHPGYAAGLLARMAGWEAAAEMVSQHHEMPDGHGYPEGLSADRICDGARILAIVDAFESVMLKHAHRGKNRSVLRAIAEVNACDNQFAKEWIEPFNQVIHLSVNA
jgi:HD-GYP domain-containing protein (c-di-GMP phosphodiesterase class II)